MIRTAFVLGAGLGTRLRPLTAVRPKPLVPVCLQPLVEYAFDHLRAHGIERFVINTHWLAEAWAREYPQGRGRRGEIAFRHEPDILETAGGIKNVEDLLGGETFIVYNGDILTDLPLAPALRAHRAGAHEVTMVLRSAGGPLQVAWEGKTQRVTAIGGEDAGVSSRYLFTGIYLVEPEFLARIPPREKIGVIPIFRQMMAEGARLGGIVIDDGEWWDLGTREKYLEVHAHFARAGGAPWISPSAQVASTARVCGVSVIGAGAKVGDGVQVHDSIIWPGAEIAPGSELHGCVVTGQAPVSGCHSQADL